MDTEKMNVNDEIKTEKPRKIRQHRILSKPFLGAVLLMVWGYSFYQMFAFFGGKNECLQNLFCALGGALLMVIHHLWFRGEFKGCISFDCLHQRQIMAGFGIGMLVDVIVNISGMIRCGFVAPGLQAVSMAMMAGVAEEAVCRVLAVSVMMRAFKDRNTYLPALLFPAVAFGLIHLTNLLAGAALTVTLLQVITAAITGVFFAAIYLRTGSIVLPIVFHFLHDLLCFMIASESTGLLTAAVTGMDLVENGALALAQLIITVWLLKGHKDEIMETWRNVWHTPTDPAKIADTDNMEKNLAAE